jgi:Cu2+-exporting ATPase
MCCFGCQAVAQTIIDSGLEDFYRYRTAPAETVSDLLPDFLQQVTVYDEPELQAGFVKKMDGDEKEATLILEGITCPACVWVNEKHLKSLSGVKQIQVNFSTRRLMIRWDDKQIKLSQILKSIHEIGYTAHPYDPQQHQQILEKERKQLLLRLGIAGALGMQVMMLAIALYTGEDMDENYKRFFRWISLLLTLPVVLFSARAFFDPALRSIKSGKPGMDIPVSLGILFAFFGSLKATLSGQGEIYYDSVVMFVFLLLLARYLELLARKRANETSENLQQLTPTKAIRLNGNTQETIPVARLEVGDLVLVLPGEPIPADGQVIEGLSSVNESLLSGESLPLTKEIHDHVIGGSINIESPLKVRVEHIGQDNLLSRITRLMERSQLEKQSVSKLADKAASWFVPVVLIMATIVSIYWWLQGDPHWFEITLAMLVATCPCALSLATPAAITVATDTLMKMGMLTTRGHAIEAPARADHFIFDKTGTLTKGQLQLSEVHTFSDLSEQQCLQIACALEQHSEHPIAQAFIEAILATRSSHDEYDAINVTNIPGAGLTGVIKKASYVIGTADHISQHTNINISYALKLIENKTGSQVFLSKADNLIAIFLLEDTLRPEANDLIKCLHDNNKKVSLLSGDNLATVQAVAEQLQIDQFQANLKSDEKLSALKQFQQQGDIVAMVGDGVNDAPVLAGAQVSIAMGGGAQLSRANADFVLLNDQLPVITKSIATVQKALRIIKQNMIWAVAYNLIALPFAAMGFLSPWMAAIGMSLSSLLVMTNALRIKSH